MKNKLLLSLGLITILGVTPAAKASSGLDIARVVFATLSDGDRRTLLAE